MLPHSTPDLGNAARFAALCAAPLAELERRSGCGGQGSEFIVLDGKHELIARLGDESQKGRLAALERPQKNVVDDREAGAVRHRVNASIRQSVPDFQGIGGGENDRAEATVNRDLKDDALSTTADAAISRGHLCHLQSPVVRSLATVAEAGGVASVPGEGACARCGAALCDCTDAQWGGR